jgi:1-acyl-sn-glycerol-3-phosphate acyltransferase
MATRPFYKRIGYNALWVLFRLNSILFFRMRVYGREHAPRHGPALICANHQSHFDPGLIGLSLDTRVNFLARRTLFDKAWLRWILEYLDSIPIDREGPALGGIKETLKRLKNEELVVIFPEGTRTRDGEISPLKPGFTTLARRAKALMVPIGIDGAYQAWPRDRWYPWFSQVVLVIGPPLTPEEVDSLSDAALVAELERRIRACHALARAKRTGKGSVDVAAV